MEADGIAAERRVCFSTTLPVSRSRTLEQRRGLRLPESPNPESRPAARAPRPSGPPGGPQSHSHLWSTVTVHIDLTDSHAMEERWHVTRAGAAWRGGCGGCWLHTHQKVTGSWARERKSHDVIV
ncbi:hypothetical protein EYF80_060481 [Liparis tanakae]|uniref:Uncharacterized protein n=1 Tax=Liparis tanakae TaxID=230148 RepID=A0A4Z2ELC9_9TELE|nr:hypothetical protein EYF80_060481 [Liparis tanakae]